MAPASSLRILVTGGAGFIGSHLCEMLVARGHHVTCLDNLSTGRLDNVRALIAAPGFKMIEADVRDSIKSTDRFNQIYNLACPASPRHYQADAVGTMRTCIQGALNALELARAHGAAVLQASTSEVYGDPTVHPQPESYVGHVNPIGPRACYDEGKRAAETLFFDYHRRHRVNVRVARIFNTYGPRMLEDDGRVVSNFVVQALTRRPLTVYGSGAQTRSFCYVDDMVGGLERLMMRGNAEMGPVNLGNPAEISVRKLAGLVLDYTGSNSPLVCKPLPQDDPTRRQPMIAKAVARLGWEPKISLDVGLRATIDYFAEVLARAKPTRRSMRAQGAHASA